MGTATPSRPHFERLTRAAKFWFVRHGESEGNRTGHIQGLCDSPLSPQGRAEAEATGIWFADKGIDQIVASPLRRCRETAALIAREAGLAEPEIDDRLIELDAGLFSNRTFREAEERYPIEWGRFQVESWESVSGAERIASLVSRAASYWEWLITRANERHPILLSITHGGLMQWIIKLTCDADRRWMPIIRIGNCSISQFCAYPTNYPRSISRPSDRGWRGGWLLRGMAVAQLERPPITIGGRLSTPAIGLS